MNEREKTIRLWFDMWLNQQDMGIDDIFTEDCSRISNPGCAKQTRRQDKRMVRCLYHE